MGLAKRKWLFVSIFILSLSDGNCLSDVLVTVNPPAVESGRTVVLSCHYDLQDDTLYTVKWYRGTREFYRFTPRDNPPGKKFSQADMFSVDLGNSNATQVTLRNVEYKLGGNVSCEVTRDKFFMTKTGYGLLDVVVIPAGDPKINLETDKYKTGDTLRGNCTFNGSLPHAKLRAYINNRPIAISAEQSENAIELILDPLKPGDFYDEKAGAFEIMCIAHVGRYFKRNSTLWVGPPKRSTDPVPARVRSSNGSCNLPLQYLVFATSFLLYLQQLLPRQST